jgi:hypothetical protein
VAVPNKETREQKNQPIIKAIVQEIKEIQKPHSYFNFENEIQKIKIPIPLLELMKNEDFKKSISNILQPEFYFPSTDLVNL